MSIGITKLFEESESLADQRRLVPAIEKLELARQLTKIPDRRAWATYNLGVIHWMQFGNGDDARREFLLAIKDFETHGHGKAPEMFRIMHAGAVENAMLCALSFEEFENLAVRLNVLTPDMPILAGLVPKVREARERGEPWSNVLFLFASSYYNRNDPTQDAGRYGEAKSTYHLLITHRLELRLKREDWGIAVSELCKLAMRLCSDCVKIRGGDADAYSPEEFLPIATDAIALANDYLTAQSGDNDVRELRSILEKNVTTFRQRWDSLNRKSAMPNKTDYRVCQKCKTVFARRDVDGPEFMTAMMDIHDHPTMCPKCGGQVVWQSSPETGRRVGRGCLAVLLFLIVAAILCYKWAS